MSIDDVRFGYRSMKVIGIIGAIALIASSLARSAYAQTDTARADFMAAMSVAVSVARGGPLEMDVCGEGRIAIRPGQLFVALPAAAHLMRVMGNPENNDLAGVVMPHDEVAWLVAVYCVKEGHVRDDGTDIWDFESLLARLKVKCEQENSVRRERGLPESFVVGWRERPSYDRGSRRLTWSLHTRSKTDADADDGVAYKTYRLGRDGYIELDLMTDVDHAVVHRAIVEDLMATFEYDDGRRYGDFDPSGDKVADFRLQALVADVPIRPTRGGHFTGEAFVTFAKVGFVAATILVTLALMIVVRRRRVPEP